ncbi:DNA/RNA non-specific endonuclease [Flavobacteriaceae bacterium]|nr:DNA/RNA non-specific endonuclease [Flavobacteriaceae bacterium]
MKKLLLVLLLVPLVSFGQEKNENYIIEGSIFKVSYNEQYEQPNWIEYKVRNIQKNFDRKGLNFYNVDSVFTSNNADYKNNIWDKGHLAPAASFSDTEANLNATFSFLNCVLQHNNLNRYEWAQLEEQVRDWSSSSNSEINVKVDIVFNANHTVLATGAHVPSAFKKTFTFSDGIQKCYYFPNEPTNGKDWTEFQIQCN